MRNVAGKLTVTTAAANGIRFGMAKRSSQASMRMVLADVYSSCRRQRERDNRELSGLASQAMGR